MQKVESVSKLPDRQSLDLSLDPVTTAKKNCDFDLTPEKNTFEPEAPIPKVPETPK